MTGPPGHVPVLLGPCLDLLQPRPGDRFIDCTVNGAGYSAAILERTAPRGTLLGIDADPDALQPAARRLTIYGDRVRLVQANFRELQDVATREGFSVAAGIVLDLGLSSNQLDAAERGFAFSREGPLDMRYDRTRGLTCADFLAQASQTTLERTLREFGDEPQARRIARAIVATKGKAPLRTTLDLARVVSTAIGGSRSRLHPATRTFQALRIAVNDELAALAEALPQAVALLRRGARLAVISFHSLEDRIVKNSFAEMAGKLPAQPRGLPTEIRPAPAQIRVLTARPVRPSAEEQQANPRSRSARLRAAERL